MKRILKVTFGLMFILSVVVGIGLIKPKTTTHAVSNSYVCAETVEKQSDIGAYFNEKIMPYVTSSATGLCVILIGLMPVIKKMLKIATDLKTAKETLSASNKENLKLKQDIEDLKQQNETLIKSQEEIKEMIKLGFCNTKELVVNGYANEIAKVGTSDETNEK